MIDTIRALLGPKHCSWCLARIRPHIDSWIDRVSGANTIGKGNKVQEMFCIFWYDYLTRLGLWKPGHNWHFKYHYGNRNNTSD